MQKGHLGHGYFWPVWYSFGPEIAALLMCPWVSVSCFLLNVSGFLQTNNTSALIFKPWLSQKDDNLFPFSPIFQLITLNIWIIPISDNSFLNFLKKTPGRNPIWGQFLFQLYQGYIHYNFYLSICLKNGHSIKFPNFCPTEQGKMSLIGFLYL